MEFVLRNLTKISLNEWYSGKHWSKRDAIKSDYKWIIKSQVKGKFTRNKKYHCEYEFHFKQNPLDATNTIAMVKMIEDCLFESDKYDIVLSVKLSSLKDKDDFVVIKITEGV